MDQLLYGCAYYDEYMPADCDRLEKDMRMIREAGMNVIRIAESTWATEEPREGVFDFSHVTRVIEAAAKEGLSVIIGTPTYAIPPWLAARHPEVLAVTERGKGKYGPRQNMDITSPAYLFYAERVIRKLMEASLGAENVIGVQMDNETKHYHTAGPNVQRRFVEHLRDTFGTVEAMNEAFGFDYWSNRVDSWENVPDVTGTINGSFAAEFEKFRRGLVTEFLLWQRGIVGEYLREDQFVTHNFDFEWRGYSFGVQPDVDHKKASAAVTLTGCDIYHPPQRKLTGKEIAFCGALTYGLKESNYLVLETQAQGHVNWTPLPGQLRLHAVSHLAAGACGVMYWHWHSIHNAMETYWKGILSHDLEPNEVYREVAIIGPDLAKLSPVLSGMKKSNRAAILVSNESLTAIDLFPFSDRETRYNDVVRWLYDALYGMNVEADILFPEDAERFSRYDMLLVPALYSAPDSLLQKLEAYAENGGCLVATFKTGFTDEHVKVRHTPQPHPHCFGARYNAFTLPDGLVIAGPDLPDEPELRTVSTWMELLHGEDGGEVLVAYDGYPGWNGYTAATKKKVGRGTAVYLGCKMAAPSLKAILRPLLAEKGLWTEALEASEAVIRSGVTTEGKRVHFYLNYSWNAVRQENLHGDAVELLSERNCAAGQALELPPWGAMILLEK
ncbi:MAG: beta-galactosidase [Oscillospiraceae bacterium]